MNRLRSFVTAVLCALALAFVVPKASAQQAKPAPQAPRPAQPPADQKRLAFNRVCAAEIKAAGTRGTSTADRIYKEVSNNPSARADLFAQLPAELRDAQTEQSRAVNLIMACAVVVTEAWESGQRTRAVLNDSWAGARAELEAEAAQPQIDPSRYVPVARSVCMNELMAMAAAREKSGESREESMNRVTQMLEYYAVPGEGREELLKTGPFRAKQEMAAEDRAELEASLCAGVTGAAVDGGLSDPDELRAFWATRKDSFFPRPRLADENRVQCANVDQGAARGNQPILLRNTCDFAITAGFCVKDATAGSTSETIACEKDRYQSHEIGPKSAALIELVDGKVFRHGSCRAPFRTALALAPDGTTKIQCWTK